MFRHITADAEYFNWAGTDFYNPDYHYSCTCKTTKDYTVSEAGVISGPVNCGGVGKSASTSQRIAKQF